MHQSEFDKIIKSKLKNFEATPPKGSFEAIQSRLQQEEKKPIALFVLPTFVKYGIAVSVAFLLGIVSVLYFQKDTTKELMANKGSKAELPIESISILDTSSVESVAISDNDETENVAISLEKTQSEYGSEVHSSNVSNESELIATNDSDSYLAQESAGKIIIDVAGLQASRKQQVQQDLKVYALYNFGDEVEELEVVKVVGDNVNSRFDNAPKKMGYTGFWFGPRIHSSLKFVGGEMLNGAGLGVDAGYDFLPDFGIQSGVHFNMAIKDVVTENSDGLQIHQLIDHSNYYIPLALKWKKSYFAKKIERPVSFNAYVGADYARLIKLKTNQFGGHFGMEYDVFLKPEMMLTLGAKAGFYQIQNYTPEIVSMQNDYKQINYNVSVYAALRFIKARKLN